MPHPRWTLCLCVIVPIATAAIAGDEAVTQFPARFFAAFRPNSALDMVKRVPGFAFEPGDANARGMAQAAGNVVIDGRRVADKNFTLDQLLDHIPATQVERIELIRGTGSGVDMLGQPIVANVVRRAAAGSITAVTVSNAHYADGRIAPGVTIERSRNSGGGHSLSVSASLSRYVEVDKGDGDRLRVDGSGDVLERAAVDARAGGSTGYVQGTAEMPAWQGQLRLNGTATWTDYRDRQIDHAFTPSPVVTRLDENLGGVGGGQAGGEIGAHYSRRFGRGLDSETTMLLRAGRKSYASVSAAPGMTIGFGERDRTAEALLRTQLRYQMMPRLAAALSLEGVYNRLDTNSALTFNDMPLALPDARTRLREKRGEAGAEATWTPGRNAELEAGMRLEHSRIGARADTAQRRSYTYFKPRLRLRLSPSARQQLRLRVEREVGQLDFANFVAAASLDKGSVSSGNAAIRPSSAWIAEGGYEWRAGAAALVLTYRHSWLHDVIDRIPVQPTDGTATFDAPGNIGGGRQDEMIGNFTLPLAPIGLNKAELSLQANWRHARVTDPTTGRQRPISNQKPFELTADFHQDLPRWKAAWGISLQSGWSRRTFLFNEEDRNRADALVKLFADVNPQPNLSVHVEASDLLGRRYRRVIDRYDGLRGARSLAYRDDRRLSLGPALSIRIRRTF